MNFVSLLQKYKKEHKNYWAERIFCELSAAYKLLPALGEKTSDKLAGVFDSAFAFAVKAIDEQGAVTKETVLKCEEMLAPFSKELKKYKIICAAHAHIDMNWMWGYGETVAVTLDTFRTMLNLMNEYDDFIFSQSQASVYEIVEKYDPEMLEEIKKRVAEKRWEVTASTWVETDKNMPNGESLTRHILYTKQYLSKLFDLNQNDLQIDFEPDTFGHNLNVPEIMENGGVKYYYHCRGFDQHVIYKYKSKSGSQVLVYREPAWYLGPIEADFALFNLEIAIDHGIHTGLKVYGVGDHGGGPTRRDIEKIHDIKTWPIYPDIKFGTFIEFFKELEKNAKNIPVVDKELNFIFDGCYTTQTRIKEANRIGEQKLYQAEALNSLSSAFFGEAYAGEDYKRGWKNILFNHFHDIIPGSGIVDTRECARGLFQDTLALTNTNISKAMLKISSRIDTAAIAKEDEACLTTSEGSGVGYMINDDFTIPNAERGKGKNRVFHVFNPTAYQRTEVITYTLWDWAYDLSRLEIKDADGTKADVKILSHGNGQPNTHFWGHSYINVLVSVTAPAFGYSTYVVSETPTYELRSVTPKDPRVFTPNNLCLENQLLKAEFDSDMNLVSLVDKNSGQELICPCGAGFRMITEDGSRGMTAWVVGAYTRVQDAFDRVRIIETNHDGIRQFITFEGIMQHSSATVTVSLDKDSPRLDYHVKLDWYEKGTPQTGVPQFNFVAPLAYDCEDFDCDIPFGVVERKAANLDIPSLSFVHGKNNGTSLMVITKTKYGFRAYDNSIAIDLVRSSFDPDPYPEIGIHNISFALQAVASPSSSELLKNSIVYNTPLLSLSGSIHSGTEAAAGSFITAEGCIVSAIKMSESGDGVILRVFEADGKDTNASLSFAKPLRCACIVDTNETVGAELKPSGNTLSFELKKYKTKTIKVGF